MDEECRGAHTTIYENPQERGRPGPKRRQGPELVSLETQAVALQHTLAATPQQQQLVTLHFLQAHYRGTPLPWRPTSASVFADAVSPDSTSECKHRYGTLYARPTTKMSVKYKLHRRSTHDFLESLVTGEATDDLFLILQKYQTRAWSLSKEVQGKKQRYTLCMMPVLGRSIRMPSSLNPCLWTIWRNWRT